MFYQALKLLSLHLVLPRREHTAAIQSQKLPDIQVTFRCLELRHSRVSEDLFTR